MSTAVVDSAVAVEDEILGSEVEGGEEGGNEVAEKPKRKAKAPKAPKAPRAKKEKITSREGCPTATRLISLVPEGAKLRNSVKGTFESSWRIEGLPGIYTYVSGVKASYVAQEGDIIGEVAPEKEGGVAGYVLFQRDEVLESLMREAVGC